MTQGPKHPNHGPSRRNTAHRWARSPTTTTTTQWWGGNHAQTIPSPTLDTEAEDDDANPAEGEPREYATPAQDDNASPSDG